MSFAYMPIFTGDYLRDTRHLSPLRHGVYLLALMHCWDSKGPMPLDEQEAAGICNCRSSDEIEALRYILGRYFIKMDDGHYNKRMSEEVAKTERLSGAFREAGLKSAEARRAKARGASTKVEPTFNQPSSKVEPRLVSPSPSPSPSHEEEYSGKSVSPAVEEPKPAPRKRSAEALGSRLPADWALPLALGQWAAQELKMPESMIRSEAAKFADYWHGVAGAKGRKADWPGTWRNWCRKALESQRPGQAPRAQQGRPLADAGAEQARQAEETRKAKAILFGGSVFDALGDVIEGEVIR